MRMASFRSRRACSRSPARVARLPLSMSAVTLALAGFMGTVWVTSKGAAICPASNVTRAESFSLGTGVDTDGIEARPDVAPSKAAKPESPGGSASAPLPRAYCAQTARSKIDDPLHDADIAAAVGVLRLKASGSILRPASHRPTGPSTRLL